MSNCFAIGFSPCVWPRLGIAADLDQIFLDAVEAGADAAEIVGQAIDVGQGDGRAIGQFES